MNNQKINIIGIFLLVFANCSSPKKSDNTTALALLLQSNSNDSSSSCKEYTLTDKEKEIKRVKSKDNLVELPYKKVGKADGKKIIVVHGGPGLSSNYNEKSITNCLAHENQLIFYDQRYTGNSTSTTVLNPIVVADYGKITLAKFVDDLETVREASLGAATKANLLGHSWGARLIAEYATTSATKSKINSVMFVSSMPFHWTGGNIRTANLVNKSKDYNITDSVGSYNKMFTDLSAAAASDLATKKTGYKKYAETYFGEFLKDKSNLSKLDFTFNDVTANNYASIFLAPLPVQSTIYRYDSTDSNITGIVGLVGGGDNKDLTDFPDVPVLIMHGDSDLFPWQYALGEKDSDTESTLDLTSFGGNKTGKDNTIKQVSNGRKNGNFPTQDGNKMFGATGVSIYYKLTTQAKVSKSKITKKKLSDTGHFPSVESPSEFRDSINDFVKKL